MATWQAGHAPFGARPNREGGWPGHCLPGRLLEGAGDRAPRVMMIAAFSGTEPGLQAGSPLCICPEIIQGIIHWKQAHGP